MHNERLRVERVCICYVLLQVLSLFLTHVTINISINGCIPKSKYMYSVGIYSVLKGKL